MTGALAVTPADINWYLSLFPNDGNVIEQWKIDGKIVVMEKEDKNVS